MGTLKAKMTLETELVIRVRHM